MKVNVIQKNKIMVALHSLDIGEGFIFDDCPCVVANSMLGPDPKNSVVAFNLSTAKVIALPEMQQVQLCQIDVGYTV